MKSEIKSEAKFKEEAETIAREAAVLGLLAKVIGDKSYDRADEAGYVKHVSETVAATQEIVSATKTGNFAAFEPALDKIYNNCNECHNGYRD